jgi:hypothetical protein
LSKIEKSHHLHTSFNLKTIEKGLFLTPIRWLIVHPKANFKGASTRRLSASADGFGHWSFSDKCNKVTRHFIIRKLGVDEGLES